MKRKLNQIIEIASNTDLWHQYKARFFGSSDSASIIHAGFLSKEEVIHQKSIESRINLNSNAVMKGIKYESFVKRQFEQRNHCIISETPMRFHSEIKFLTATPDGQITNYSTTNYKYPIGTLTEFKVRSHLDRKIPYKYYIQCQIQMEVFDLDTCIYCENLVNESTNTLDDYYELVIHRNSEWFKKFQKELLLTWNIICTNKSTIRDGSYKNLSILPAESFIMTHNFLWNTIHKEPLGDWLVLTSPPIEENQDSFPTMIHSLKLSFKYEVKKHIDRILNTYNLSNAYRDVDADLLVLPKNFTELQIKHPEINKFNQSAIDQTKRYIRDGVPIIFNSHHCCNINTNDTTNDNTNSSLNILYTKCDLLIQKKFLKLLISEGLPFSINDEEYVENDEEQKENLYYPVLIEYSTLNLKVDKAHLLHNEKQNMYLAKLAFLQKILNTFDHDVKIASRGFIIGRKSEYTQKGVKHVYTSAFDKIAVIDLMKGGVDEEMNELVNQCIEWFNFLHSSEFQKYRNIPVTKILKQSEYANFKWKSYLHPNCKNHNDNKYAVYKKQIVAEVGELTQLYKFGIKNRNYAHSMGITTIEELRKHPEIGIKNNESVMYDQLTAFLNSIKTGQHQDNKNNNTYADKLAKEKHPLECFIDFEFASNLDDDFKTFPICSKTIIVYMLGCTYVDNLRKTITHRTYLTNRLNVSDEQNLICHFIQDLYQFKETSNTADHIKVYHWSNAEKNILYNLLKHNDQINGLNLEMQDLLQFIRDEKLILPNTNGFGLKEIGKKLYEMGLIKTCWKDELQGLSSMVYTLEAENYCKNIPGKNLIDYHKMKKVVDYNYIDCIVIKEILDVLRGT